MYLLPTLQSPGVSKDDWGRTIESQSRSFHLLPTLSSLPHLLLSYLPSPSFPTSSPPFPYPLFTPPPLSSLYNFSLLPSPSSFLSPPLTSPSSPLFPFPSKLILPHFPWTFSFFSSSTTQLSNLLLSYPISYSAIQSPPQLSNLLFSYLISYWALQYSTELSNLLLSYPISYSAIQSSAQLSNLLLSYLISYWALQSSTELSNLLLSSPISYLAI